jgi:superfamily II DNA or RNA helicase
MSSEFIEAIVRQRLDAYRANPQDIVEHHGIELTVLAGGYGYRQVLELVQNAADAILEGHHPEQQEPGRIEIVLDGAWLYAANTGVAFTEEGVSTLLHSHSSTKRGDQIGRFGLGFKSLLALGGEVEISSGPWSFYFDPARCRRSLQEEFRISDAPGFRLAWPLPAERQSVLSERFPWATTVVAARIVSDEGVPLVRKELEDFPAEFLLFQPRPTEICLVATASDAQAVSRSLSAERAGDVITLLENGQSTRWQVSEWRVDVSDDSARIDATHIHNREQVTMTWARPTTNDREIAGRFWAYFPTQTQSRVPGLLHAPWKLNSDRNAIIPGPWNSGLMRLAGQHIARKIPEAATDSDVGAPLDLFPRQPDRQDEPAVPLVNAVWETLIDLPVIADCTGTLSSARHLHRHAVESAGIVEAWNAQASDLLRRRFVHPSCLLAERASRLRALATRLASRTSERDMPDLRPVSVPEWLQPLASLEQGTTRDLLSLIELVSKDPTIRGLPGTLGLTPIIPSALGTLVEPTTVLLGAPQSLMSRGEHAVVQWIADDTELCAKLREHLAVRTFDRDKWQTLLHDRLHSATYGRSHSWESFWQVLRAAPVDLATAFVRENRDVIRVLRRDGCWRVAGEVLLIGPIVSVQDDPNQGMLLSSEYHQNDGSTLQQLGLSVEPIELVNVYDPPALAQWLENWRHYYSKNVNQAADHGYLVPKGTHIPRGFALLTELQGAARSKWTWRLMESVTTLPAQVEFGHRNNNAYQKIRVAHPLRWWILAHGTYTIADRQVKVATLAERLDRPSFKLIPGWLALREQIGGLRQTGPIALPTRPDNVELWNALFCLVEDASQPTYSDLWSDAAEDGCAPSAIRVGTDNLDLSSVYVTSDSFLAEKGRSLGLPIVRLAATALPLWTAAGAQLLENAVSITWSEQEPTTLLLCEVLPELADVIPEAAHRSATCRIVRGLAIAHRELSVGVPAAVANDQIVLDWDLLIACDLETRSSALVSVLERAELIATTNDDAHVLLRNAARETLITQINSAGNDAERLLIAIGGDGASLRVALGDLGSSPFLEGVEPRLLAELVLSQIGPHCLASLEDALDRTGLRPPRRWGTEAARTFVTRLGFPLAFAEGSSARRDPEEWVPGPEALPPLRRFQEDVLKELNSIFVEDRGERRAVLSLPTGAGKTRVAVEATLKLISQVGQEQAIILWIAQTDELCEQAVQTFRRVWTAKGQEGISLRVCRLWGGNPTPMPSDQATPIVVVASIQTVAARIRGSALLWLQRAALVVLDECHHAIAPSYTELLGFLGISSRPNSEVDRRPSLLGLSATPFRANESESERLAKRFASTLVPREPGRLYDDLVKEAVLARVEFADVDSGQSLTADELALLASILSEVDLDGVRLDNVLTLINDRLGRIDARNERLVDIIRESTERSIIVFANSVDHARELSARLQLAGVPAAAVDGELPAASRRFFLERFQRGEIRALCNYNVLSTGFDAPKTDMVLITRVVFSAVRFMQMVGRGLRGTAHGGTSSCRIVTVSDNLAAFADKSPAHYCARYFATT